MSEEVVRILLMGLAYASGAIPYALIVSRARGVDIRNVGSRNPGAHNVMVHVGRWPGRLVAILDLLKGTLPALLARLAGLSDWDAVWVGVAAMLGHITSPFLGFRGGKGLATAFGVMLALAPIETVIGSLAGLTVLRLIRFVPAAAAVAALVTFGLMIARGAGAAALASPWIMMAIALMATLAELIGRRRSRPRHGA